MQTISLGAPFINLKGEWTEDIEYEYLDAVTSEGSLFIANKKFIPAGTAPGKNEAWLLISRGVNEENVEKKISEQVDLLISNHENLTLESGAHTFPKGTEGQVLTIKNGKYVFKNPYALCEFYTRMYLDKEKAFLPAVGTLINNADTKYPDAWAFLQTDVGKTLCVTEEEWQEMTTKTYYTATSPDEAGIDVKKEFSFDGIGGAPFYVQDSEASTLRVPDVRGMYMEASGFDDLAVGGVHLDSIQGHYHEVTAGNYINTKENRLHINGGIAFKGGGLGSTYATGDAFKSNGGQLHAYFMFEDEHNGYGYPRTGKYTKPRAFGINYCVYLGNLVK